MSKSSFICPETGDELVESDSPLLNLDRVVCPWCGRTHWIRESFSGGLVNRYAASVHAPRQGFLYVRSDRDALEYVATRRTEWDTSIAAYTIGDCIFWPHRRAMRRITVLRHEQCHVEQSRRNGPVWFSVRYWLEHLLRGYQRNRFEEQARRAERRRPRR